MSVDIDTVTIGTEDRRLVLTNAQAARVLAVGSTWNSIRIGIRFAFDDTGANLTGTPNFLVGMLSNPVEAGGMLSNGPLSGAATSHFIGIRNTDATWTRSAGYYSIDANTFQATKKVGSTTSNGSAVLTGQTSVMEAAPATNHSIMIVFLIKGSPWTVYFARNASTSETHKTQADLITALEASDPYATLGYAATPQPTLTVDEATDGYLNAVCVAWDRTTPALRIADVMYSIQP